MPRTEARERLLNDLTKGGPHLIGPGHWRTAIDAIEAEAVAAERARMAPPAGARLVLIVGDLLASLGMRTDDGSSLTYEWGEPDEHGWYEPVITRHDDDNLVAAERERITERVGKLFDSPAAYPAPMGPTIRAENDVVRAVLAIVNPEAER